MIIKCKQCGSRSGEPVAVGGVTTMLPAAVVTGLMGGVLMHWMGNWIYLLLLPLWVLLTWLFWEGPRWLTALRYRRRHCPQCGACQWERPEYSGFGL